MLKTKGILLSAQNDAGSQIGSRHSEHSEESPGVQSVQGIRRFARNDAGACREGITRMMMSSVTTYQVIDVSR